MADFASHITSLAFSKYQIRFHTQRIWNVFSRPRNSIPYGACEMHDIIVFEMTSVSCGALPGSKFNPANLSKLVNLIYQKLYLYSPRNDTQFRVGDHFGGCTYSPSKGLNSSKNRLNSYNTLIWHYINFFTLSYLIHSPFLRKR